MNIVKSSISRLLAIQQHIPASVRLLSSVETAPAADGLRSDVQPREEPELDKLYKKIDLEVKGNDPAVLASYTWFAKTACQHLQIETGEITECKKPHKQLFTLLRSRHVHKKHRTQYEIRTYYKYMSLHRLTGSTCDTVLEYLERNLPEGVAMKVTKTELQPLPDYMKNPIDVNVSDEKM